MTWLQRSPFSVGFGWSLVVATLWTISCAGAVRRPNIILFVADDLGHGDLSSYGGQAVPTPHLDALASGGLKFTRFYAASAVCSPTRASILTGRYPLRFDIRRHFPDDHSHLRRGTATLPVLLRRAGYATAHVGKWHLGGLRKADVRTRPQGTPGPLQHGFEHALTQWEDPPIRALLGAERRMYRDGGLHLVRNDRSALPLRKHYTDINADEIVGLIEKYHREKRPFFINAWWLEPHTPYEPAPEPFWSRTASPGITDDQHRFRSMLAHLDARIGTVVAKLVELGIERDTFIMFTSDNGAAWEGSTGGLAGGKTDLHEGGLRVPGIAVWPGRIAAGGTSHEFAHSSDILPTLCAVAGVTPDPGMGLDGFDLLPHMMTGAPAPQRNVVFWQMDLYDEIQRHERKPAPYATEAARRGPWKLLARDGRAVELFNLDQDPRERVNRLAERPDIAAELGAALRRWLVEPRLSVD